MKRNSKNRSLLSEVLSSLKRVVFTDALVRAYENAEERFIEFKKRFTQKIVGNSFLTLGAIFLLSALYYYLLESLFISRLQIFSYFGIASLFIGLSLKYLSLKK